MQSLAATVDFADSRGLQSTSKAPAFATEHPVRASYPQRQTSSRPVAFLRPQDPMPTFTRTLNLDHSAQDVYAWHARPGAFARLTPPWQGVQVLESTGEFESRRVVMRIGVGPGSVRWLAQHRDAVAGQQFVDEQVEGPFSLWQHTHRFVQDPQDPHKSQLIDEVEWTLPVGAVGQFFGGGSVQATLERTFAFRHRRTQADLDRHGRFDQQPRLRVAVSGASGLVGTALVAYLETAGHSVLRLVRRKTTHPGEIAWDPATGTVDMEGLAGVDAVIHLAGENVGDRWSAERRRAILQSRVDGTATLARALAQLKRPPRVLISASAVGFYGDTGADHVDERSPRGGGFLAEVCEAWEQAADPARQAGIRVVHPRLGVVLTPDGGALAKMLPAFRLGAGGPLGTGNQGFPWVALDDVLAVLELALYHEGLLGPVNVVAPNPISQREFAHALGAALGRPAFVPTPAAAIALMLGDMGREVLLAGQRVAPLRLRDLDFAFQFSEIADLLRFVLGADAAVGHPT